MTAFVVGIVSRVAMLGVVLWHAVFEDGDPVYAPVAVLVFESMSAHAAHHLRQRKRELRAAKRELRKTET